jgi:hypothetical protein
METNDKQTANKIYKVIIAVLIAIIGVLVWQLVVTKIEIKTIIVEKGKSVTQSQELQTELDSLLTEHKKIKKEYSGLTGKMAAKDSVIQSYADEIQRLIASQADYGRIKRKLEFLRSITQGYVAQIDSLYTVNRNLKNENKKITEDFNKEKEKTTELTKDKEDLATKVTTASTLKAYNISGVGIRTKQNGKKEEDAEKAKRVDKLKISFTLSENLIIPPGEKTIYVRIARPDSQVLCMGSEDTYSFMFNGQRLQYSLKQDINYQNKAQNITLYWVKTTKNESAMKGVYNVSVFCDDTNIGESSFELK